MSSLAAHALAPGVDVGDGPVAVLRVAGEREGVEGERGGQEVLGVIADDVVVVAEVLQHLLIAGLAVARGEPPGDLDRVPGPVERRRPAEQRPAAAVEQAADDPMPGVVVGGGRVGAVVEVGVADGTPQERGVVGLGEALEEERAEALGVVEPVELGGELAVVHPVPAQGDSRGAGQGVLAEVAFPAEMGEASDLIGGAQGVEQGPVAEGLAGVVGAVVAAPALDAEGAAVPVEVAVEEDRDGLGVGAQQGPLQQRHSGAAIGVSTRITGPEAVGGSARQATRGKRVSMGRLSDARVKDRVREEPDAARPGSGQDRPPPITRHSTAARTDAQQMLENSIRGTVRAERPAEDLPSAVRRG